MGCFSLLMHDWTQKKPVFSTCRLSISSIEGSFSQSGRVVVVRVTSVHRMAARAFV